MTPELSRIVRAHDIGSLTRHESIKARPVEREALARRFDLLALDSLTAELDTVRDAAGIRVTGRFAAAGTQPCAVSAEPVPFSLDEPIDLHFSEHAVEAGELELSVPDLDVLPLDGDQLDLGEAVAQSFGLALNPYPRAPDEVRAQVASFITSEEAEAARLAAEKARSNPFAVLKGGRS